MANVVDIAIIGGGLSGLGAAYAIRNSAPKVKTVVLEADSRLGGRTLTNDDLLDLGGGYVGGTQNYMQLLIRALEIPTFSQYLPPDKQWLYQDGGGVVTRYPGNDPYDLPGGTNALEYLAKLDALALHVRAHLNAPWEAAGAAEWDAISVQDFIDGELAAKNMTQETADIMTVSVRSAFSVEPKELSFLFMLQYAASAGTYSALVDVTGGPSAAEGTRFTYGTKSLVDKLAATLGDDVQLGAEVATIEQQLDGDGRGQGVVIRTKDRRVWECARVIVAMSPRAAARLGYQPALATLPGGPAREDLARNMPLGRTIKAFVQFKSPFWRWKGLMGYLLSAGDPKVHPVDWTLDNSWEPANPDPRGPQPRYRSSLMTFMVGDSATFWGAKTLTRRRQAVLDHLESVYGPDFKHELLPSKADQYVERDWQKPPQLGAPTGILGPGVLTRVKDAVRAPVGLVHWAGTEAAHEWSGYMNGALQSGWRAASEALAALQAQAVAARAAGKKRYEDTLKTTQAERPAFDPERRRRAPREQRDEPPGGSGPPRRGRDAGPPRIRR